MVNRVQTNRMTSIGQRPPAGTRAPGELYVNFPDGQLGVIDETQNPNDLIAVRFFSPNTNYNSGDVVWNEGHLWHASQDIPAGAFNPAQWDQSTTNSGTGAGNYLPLTGGTMIGALELAGDPTSALGAATKEYADTKLALSGGTMTGDLQVMTTPATANSAISQQFLNLTVGRYLPLTGGAISGALSVGTSFTVGPLNVISSGGHYGAGGPSAGYFALDRGNSGGNTSNWAVIYRDANICRLGNTEAGDVMQWNPQGNMQVNYQLVVAGLLTAAASLNVTGTENITGTGSYPLNLSAPAGYNCAIGYYPAGQQTWLAGAFENNMYGVLNATAGYWAMQSYNGITVMPVTTYFDGQIVAQYQSHYPIQVDAAAGMNGAIQFSTPGQEQWMCGPLPSVAANTFYIWDAALGARISASPSQVITYGSTTLAAGGSSQVVLGGAGDWNIGYAFCVSPQAGGSYGSGGGIGCYSAVALGPAIGSRVDTTGAFLHYFMYGTTGVGSITTDGNSTYYNTTSDARLKDNIRHLRDEVNVGALIDNLTPVAFEWKPVNQQDLDGNDISILPNTDHGFIAQQLYQHVPRAVHRPSDDSQNWWGTDLTKLIPFLVAEIQQLRIRVAEVERNPPPVNTVPPTIQTMSGPPEVGSLLINGSVGTWTGNPSGYTRQWQRNGNMIAGATGTSYTVVAADWDTYITCQVTATNAFGSSSVNSNRLTIEGDPPVSPPTNQIIPNIVLEGPPMVGAGTTVFLQNSGTWTGSPILTYQWYRQGTLITGETGERYTVAFEDAGRSLWCQVTGTNAGGSLAVNSNQVNIIN